MTTTVVTGIKPTGTPHLGNYAGAIAPALALAREPTVQSYFLVADGHALNSARSPDELRRHAREAAATLLALGLDLERSVLCRQSDIPEIFELAAILACFCPKGLANRAHAYKAATDANRARGSADLDAGVNMGLFTYPLLMTADIVAFDAELVPVGEDQRQHVEIARELAQRLNRFAGDAVRVPDIRVQKTVGVLPGIDGRKMSKSYGNTIPLFCPSDELRSLIFRMKTDAREVGEPAEPDGNALFELFRLFARPEELGEMRAAFGAGAGYGLIKQRVFEVLDRELAQPRLRYQALLESPEALSAALAAGGARARPRAREVLDRVKLAVGLGAMAPQT